jgi:hypothetical protein
VIDTTTEHLISLNEVAAYLPSRNGPGKKLALSTIQRWISPGMYGVALESVKIGGGTYTSREAVQRFAEALSAPAARKLAAKGL